ncbi:MAG: polyprenyl synthetase family protein [Anaerolineales bacterium]
MNTLTQLKINSADWSTSVKDQLQAVESRLHQVPANQHDEITAAGERLFNAGGKRVRPAVCLLTAGVFQAEPVSAVALASAVELLHTATLVHDDLIDGANMRRGVATLNADWSPEATVLMGDYLFARAATLIAETDSVKIMDLFAQTMMIILNGEIAQRFARWQVNRQEYYQRIYAKTAALFVLATESASVLGKADRSHKNAMIDYGHSLGLAFQIVDDVLDFTGSSKSIGKPAGNDLRQGLITLPAILFREKYPEDKDFSALLNGRHNDSELVAHMVERIRDSSAIEASLKEARTYAHKAQNALSHVPFSRNVESLSALAEYVVFRNL